MNCYFFTRYDVQGASSRARSYQFIPLLQRAGHNAVAIPLLDRHYLERRYRGARNPPWYLPLQYVRRIRDLLNLPRPAVVVIEKELFPYLPSGAEQLLGRAGHTVVVDYDDAIFRNYTESRNALVRHLLTDKIPQIMRAADLVTVGSHYLADYAREHGARQILHLPTVIDLERYVPTTPPPSNQLRIGWIGTPLTTSYLRLVAEPLAKLGAQIPIRLICIGGADFQIPSVPIENLPWSLESEVEFLNQIDVGIMPLSAGPWEQGKCAYKLIQCMALKKAVVAADVGENRYVVRSGETGLLAATNEEWIDRLLQLAYDPALRNRLGTAARKEIETNYSLQAVGPRLITALENAHAKTTEKSQDDPKP
jgi:glycosyltransferase involved in cell wall biosynthesis